MTESLNNEVNNDQFLRIRGKSVAYLGNSIAFYGTTIDNAKSNFLPNGKSSIIQFSIYDNNNDPFSV